MPPTSYIALPSNGSDPQDEWIRLGVTAHLQNNLPLAQQHYQQALRLDPRNAIATMNLAIVFAQSNMINEGLLAMERAEMFDGVLGVVKMNYALMAFDAERIDLAVEKAKKAVEMQPDANSKYVLALISASAGHPDEAIPLYADILKEVPNHPAAGPNSCFVQTLTDTTPEAMLKQRQIWYEAHACKEPKQPHDNDRLQDRSLRVGYVGGDFKSHSAAFIFRNVVLHHTDLIQVYLYSSLPVDEKVDVQTGRFKAKAGDRWRDISTMSDEDAAKLIRRDKIDILVDLAGHTNGGRLALFTRKPAPVQATAWGFAHGTGVPEIDYFFADPIAVPETERQFYAEKVYDLPCIVTFEPPTEYGFKPISSAPFKKNGFITFGSYARYEKMSEECLRCMSEVVRRVPDSRIQFKDNSYRRPYAIRRIMSLMPDIAPERMLFSIGTSHMEHMLAYQQADLCLDPFPHGGGCVALETLYMGVPLITRYGTQAAGRTGASVLACMGRTDWIAASAAEYVEKAVDWATNRQSELQAARQTLRKEFVESSVVKGYTEAVEQAYRVIWQRWCQQ